MKHSRERILTTHVGSLPRPQEVVDQLFAQDSGADYDEAAFDATMARAVREVAQQQADAGVDVISDGEMSKISYATYMRHRLTGFELSDAPPPRATPLDLDEFPAFRDRLAQQGGTPQYHRPVVRGPIEVRDLAPLEKDIANLQAAASAAGAQEAFMNAASPGVIAVFQPNEYYRSDADYLEALAAVMKVEYERITGAGLLLQVDCPDLAMGRHIRFRDADTATFRRAAIMQVEALNAALENVPAEKVRIHLCWGNYEGPHTHDVDLAEVIDIVLQVKAQAIQFEGANPRHAHEWRVWADADLGDERILIPGVLDTTTNFVEHPQLVAERIERYAAIVGRERVLAGTDCGFGTFAGFGAVHPDIAWAKLRSLAEGARRASEGLWA
ncbi:MAG: cobalamin-independent methionine synthase II family protein [Anaerolineaceae bacterium]|nr:cobalamin-independent methionine synthase II family protein [Anaerolineaceae bacterium]